MNKIVIHVGLLIFCVSIIFFAQRGLPLEQVLLRSFMVFAFVTIMLAIIAILIIKSVGNSRSSYKKDDNLAKNLGGK